MNFPIDQLALIVVRLFQLNGDTRLSDGDRALAYQRANLLHTYSEVIVHKQFDQNTAEYQTAINQMNQVNADLANVANDINAAIAAVNDAAGLIAAVENLLKTAASFGVAD